MRKWIDLINESERAPAILWHGTQVENLILIYMSGVINAGECDEGHTGVSWTGNFEIAKGFGSFHCRDGDLLHSEILFRDHPEFEGVVMEAPSAALGRIEEFDHNNDGEHIEQEWRTHGNVPLTAVTKIYLHKHELEQYRDTFLDAQRSYTVKAWDGISPDYEPEYLKWADDFIRDPQGRRLAAINAILSDPRVVPYA